MGLCPLPSGGLPPAVASGDHSSSRCAGLSLSWPLVAEHGLQTRGLSSCGSRAQLLRGMWDPPRPGLEPVSPALAGRLSTTAPRGKPPPSCIFTHFFSFLPSFLPPSLPSFPLFFLNLFNFLVALGLSCGTRDLR